LLFEHGFLSQNEIIQTRTNQIMADRINSVVYPIVEYLAQPIIRFDQQSQTIIDASRRGLLSPGETIALTAYYYIYGVADTTTFSQINTTERSLTFSHEQCANGVLTIDCVTASAGAFVNGYLAGLALLAPSQSVVGDSVSIVRNAVRRVTNSPIDEVSQLIVSSVDDAERLVINNSDNIINNLDSFGLPCPVLGATTDSEKNSEGEVLGDCIYGFNPDAVGPIPPQSPQIGYLARNQSIVASASELENLATGSLNRCIFVGLCGFDETGEAIAGATHYFIPEESEEILTSITSTLIDNYGVIPETIQPFAIRGNLPEALENYIAINDELARLGLPQLPDYNAIPMNPAGGTFNIPTQTLSENIPEELLREYRNLLRQYYLNQ
jgi:hypothetical protein